MINLDPKTMAILKDYIAEMTVFEEFDFESKIAVYDIVEASIIFYINYRLQRVWDVPTTLQ